MPFDLQSLIWLLSKQKPVSDDSGDYKCIIKNEHGELVANLKLNIEGAKYLGDPPKFVEKPKISSERNGKLIIMECKVKAKPKPEITWFYENSLVIETTRIRQTITEENEIYVIRLEIHEPEYNDSGVYRCNVRNIAGESNANLTLNIESKPSLAILAQISCNPTSRLTVQSLRSSNRSPE